jgi:hypothetical protein
MPGVGRLDAESVIIGARNSMRFRVTVIMILVVLASLTVCCELPPVSSDNQSSSSKTNASYQSGGLGLKSSEWESVNGSYVDKGAVSDVWVYQSNGRKLYVTFWGDIVRAVEHNYPTPVALEVARTDAKNFLPTDAQLMETYPFSSRHVKGSVDLYLSPSLPNRLFPTAGRRADIWLGGQPGSISVIYRTTAEADGVVTTMSVEAGRQFYTRR